jgi:glycosyltransferase involved in cell wall biosynthesis
VDVLVPITEETAEIAREVFGLRRPVARVIELGVDADLFRPDHQRRERMRQELGLSPTDFVVIYTGKVIPAKGVHWLVEALSMCPARVHALILGNAAAGYRLLIDGLVAEHGLQGRVLCYPAVKQVDLPGYYVAADAGCWPRETSLAMLEASACGLPVVVVTDGVQTRVRNRSGLQYHEANVPELARCLTRLAQHRQEAEAMGRRGRQLIEDHYTWEHIGRQFSLAYSAGDEPAETGRLA